MLKNSISNFLGTILPSIVSLLTIPYIVKSLGPENYGVLTMVTAIVGYFAVLDLNITAASVKFVAEYNALNQLDELNQVITFGALIYVILGITGLVGIYFSAEYFTNHFFTLPSNLIPLVVKTIKLAAIGFLFSQIQCYLNSIPQALQRYDITSKLESLFGALVPILTILVLFLGHGLYGVVLLRVVLSFVNIIFLVAIVKKIMPSYSFCVPKKFIMKRLGSFSAFAYLSKIAGVVYSQADKLIIGSMLSMTSLTYYTIPFTITTRILSASSRLSTVIFPVASAMQSTNQLVQLKEVYFAASKYIYYVNVCILVVMIIFSGDILFLWMGKSYAENGTLIMITICVAAVIDSITNIPSLVNDAFGHTKVTGFFALVRAFIAIIMTVVLTKLFGILGAAVSQVVAAIIGTVGFLIYAHNNTIPYKFSELLKHSYMLTSIFALSLTIVAFLLKPAGYMNIFQLLFFSGVVVIVCLYYGYRVVLNSEHRSLIVNQFKRRLMFN